MTHYLNILEKMYKHEEEYDAVYFHLIDKEGHTELIIDYCLYQLMLLLVSK